MRLEGVKFIKSAADKSGWIDDETKEIVMLGRSNVGKSTFINSLSGNSSLAHVSSKPGKTKLLNFFSVQDKYRLVDAPGYGYAGVSGKDSENFDKMMSEYLSEREHLVGALYLLDSRRIPNKDDLHVFDMLVANHIPFIIIMTKIDKLNQSEKAKLDKTIRYELGVGNDIEIINTTSMKLDWVERVINKLDEFIK